MIRSLHFSNLKAFSGDHEVGLAPLTLIYGRNSAGKSTIMQALLLLKQTLESSDPERPALVIRGPLTDLGSVPGILHDHDLSARLKLGVEVEQESRRTAYTHLSGGTRRRLTFEFEWDSEAASIRQTGMDVAIAGENVATYSRRRGRRGTSIVSEARTARVFPFQIGIKANRVRFINWLMSYIMSDTPRNRRVKERTERVVGGNRDEIVEVLIDRATFSSRSWGIVPYAADFKLKSIRGKEDEEDEEDEAVVELLSEMELAWWNVLMETRLDVMDAFDQLVYLGPLRSAPERFHILSGAQRKSVGREGQFSAELLRQDPKLAATVNEWLEKLDIPYKLDAIPLEAAEVTHSIGDVVVLVLTDLRNDLQISAGDVGFGISQLLPIVVQSYVSEGTTICIEQPEIHVHPRLQGHMAELFVDAVTREGGNQFIIETHSENLMLRLQSKVRSGDIQADQISVLYVDTDESGNAQVLDLRLDDDGEFIDEWPEGFFEERFDEVFGAGGSGASEGSG